jgi:hypothetical protein
MHLDIETDDLEAEVERLTSLGAVPWDHEGPMCGARTISDGSILAPCAPTSQVPSSYRISVAHSDCLAAQPLDELRKHLRRDGRTC